jgi:hypothetical protein
MKKNIENSEAAIRTDRMFALVGVRCLKNASGASGDRERDSMNTNSAISATAPASPPSVRPAPQP